MVSMQGMMKNNPGPTAPLRFTLPNRKITALWYSLRQDIQDGVFCFLKDSYLDLLHRHKEGEGEGAEDEEHGYQPDQGAHASTTTSIISVIPYFITMYNNSLFFIFP